MLVLLYRKSLSDSSHTNFGKYYSQTHQVHFSPNNCFRYILFYQYNATQVKVIYSSSILLDFIANYQKCQWQHDKELYFEPAILVFHINNIAKNNSSICWDKNLLVHYHHYLWFLFIRLYIKFCIFVYKLSNYIHIRQLITAVNNILAIVKYVNENFDRLDRSGKQHSTESQLDITFTCTISYILTVYYYKHLQSLFILLKYVTQSNKASLICCFNTDIF